MLHLLPQQYSQQNDDIVYQRRKIFPLSFALGKDKINRLELKSVFRNEINIACLHDICASGVVSARASYLNSSHEFFSFRPETNWVSACWFS